MSRATSGLAISPDNSARRASCAEISASMGSGARAFLMTFTPEDPPPTRSPLSGRDPPATAGGTDFIFPLFDFPDVGCAADLPRGTFPMELLLTGSAPAIAGAESSVNRDRAEPFCDWLDSAGDS